MAIIPASDSDRTWEPIEAEHQVLPRRGLQTGGDTAIVRTMPKQTQSLYTSESAQLSALPQDEKFLIEEQVAMVTIGPIYGALHDERARLVTREISGDISRDEARRLSYVRWQLDQYESAQLGPDIRKLRRISEAQTSIAQSVSALVHALDQSAPSRKRR